MLFAFLTAAPRHASLDRLRHLATLKCTTVILFLSHGVSDLLIQQGNTAFFHCSRTRASATQPSPASCNPR